MSDQSVPYDGMAVRDEHVPEDLFAEFVERMPQVCVEIVLETAAGLFLAKRAIEPEIWFWPGSRLYKGETLEEAAHRVAREEVGIEVTILDQYGPYEHFWKESSTEGSPSRHTVNTVYHVEPADDEYEITLDDQHSEYRFLTRLEPDLHEYVHRYVEDNDLL